MRLYFTFTIFLLSTTGLAQIDSGKLSPVVTSITMDPSTVTVLHLAEGYSTSVKVPEEISAVVIGNPGRFKAEHSEAEPRLVFLKPTTELQCESNALITMKSGMEINLYLISRGKAVPNARVDFFVEYRRPESLGVDVDQQSFLIPETQSAASESPQAPTQEQLLLARELETERVLPSLQWAGAELQGAIGKAMQYENKTILGFSILNNSKRAIALLPPQIELSGAVRGSGAKQIKAEPVAISEYRISARTLQPGQRADGVLMFQRPSFKQSSEKLQLQIAEAERIDRPLLLDVPFTASSQEGVQ